jgi:hypothetical protein
MNYSDLSVSQLRKAADISERIQVFRDELFKLFAGQIADGPASSPKHRHKMSTVGRDGIRAAQKARWAKIKKSKAV